MEKHFYRIGNYLSIYGFYRQIDKKLLQKLHWYQAEDVKPVELSDLWLENLGFERMFVDEGRIHFRFKVKSQKFVDIMKINDEYILIAIIDDRVISDFDLVGKKNNVL